MNAHPASRIIPRPLRGFTLVELLTVIAIIGVLAGIIIPTVGKVRTSAKRSQGLSNLRQIAVAGLSFSTENRGRWFYGDDKRFYGDPETVFWADRLTSYMGDSTGQGTRDYSQVFHDPLITNAPSATSGRRIHFAHLLAYSGYSNNQYCTLTPYNNLRQAGSPQNQILIADIVAGDDGQSAWANIQYAGKNNSMWSWPGQWGGFTPNEADANWTPPSTYGFAPGEIDFGRDPGRAKVAYLDGHVASVTRDQLKHRNLDPRY